MPKKKAGLFKISCMLAGFLLLSCVAFAQKTITGKIINDASKEPVAGATVQVRGAKGATQTNADGTFSVKAPKDNSILVVSMIGFENSGNRDGRKDGSRGYIDDGDHYDA